MSETPPIPSSRFELAPGIYALEDSLRLQYSRSAGPGGQNVNKVNTKAELWLPIAAIVGMNGGAISRLRVLAGKRLTQAGELHLSSQTERSQESNRQRLFENLRELIVKSLIEPKVRKKIRPSRAAKVRRMESKKRRGNIKAGRRDTREW
jgi:ribosome-associated protein